MALKVNALSYSTISQYAQCSQKVWYDKIEHRQKRGISAALVFGSAFHAAAEAWFRSLALESPLSPDVLLRVFRLSWERNNEKEIRYGKKDNKDTLFGTATKLLIALTEAERPHKIVAVEKSVAYPIASTLKIVGKLDLLTRDKNGDLELWDLKTSAKAYAEEQLTKVREQAFLYALGIPEPVKLKTRVALKTKNPRIDDIDLNIDDISYNEIHEKALMTAKAIEAGIHYRNRSWMCASCPYSYLCDGQAEQTHEYKLAA